MELGSGKVAGKVLIVDHMRLATVGIILLFALRYFPDGLLPEQKASGETKNRNSNDMS